MSAPAPKCICGDPYCPHPMAPEVVAGAPPAAAIATDPASTQLHELKCWPDAFAALFAGRKQFEYRRDDRGFRVGDWLRLREWDPAAERYTGRHVERYVSYILRGPDHGVPPGYCVMSVAAERRRSDR